MRVTQGMIAKNSLRYINSSYGKLDKLQSQISSGKKITKASDDPVVAMKSLKYNTQLSQVKQYQSNASQAFTWLENTETNITEGIDIMAKIRELTVKAQNSTNGKDELNAIGVEIGQLKDQLIQIANTQVNGRYLLTERTLTSLRSQKTPMVLTHTILKTIQAALTFSSMFRQTQP